MHMNIVDFLKGKKFCIYFNGNKIADLTISEITELSLLGTRVKIVTADRKTGDSITFESKTKRVTLTEDAIIVEVGNNET